MKNPIIVALDLPDAESALRLAEGLVRFVGAYKIGSELFTSAGPDIVKRIRGLGGKVFLDLKFHDIPNTVAKAVAAAVHYDVQMLTIHTSGGREMMKAAEESAQKTAADLGRSPPLLLGVTILTSLDSKTIGELGFEAEVGRQVQRLAALAVDAGLRGLVCSPREVSALRQVLPPNLQLVTPGVRPNQGPVHDQKRTLSPRDALSAGADWLVIGRPIYDAENPVAAAESILASIQES